MAVLEMGVGSCGVGACFPSFEFFVIVHELDRVTVPLLYLRSFHRGLSYRFLVHSFVGYRVFSSFAFASVVCCYGSESYIAGVSERHFVFVVLDFHSLAHSL